MKALVWTAPVAAALAVVAGSAAATTDLFLGQSAQDYVLYGQGPIAPGIGSFTNQQGSESYDAGTNTTTDTLSGLITGSTDPALGSGAYAFVTTYLGTPIGSGGAQITSQSNPMNVNFFFYDFFAPSVDMTLHLTGTPSGNVTIPVVTNGLFDGPGFSFADVTAMCANVAVCTQNNVGLTPGASIFGPVTMFVSLASVPEPAPWAMMLVGVAVVGATIRRKAAAQKPVPA